MSKLLLRLTVLSLTCFVTASSARADVRLPHVFGSHMVLQREMPVPVWGWADAGEDVTVGFRDQTKSTKAGDDGKWQVTLDALAVGEPATLSVKGKNTVTLDDVLVGEVWLASGQSNMQWSIAAALDPDLESLAASHSQIRLFYVPRVANAEPQTDVDAQWKLCTPENISEFSAVCYFFGRQLQETLGVPVGLIHTSWGGTRAEAWASAEGMASRGEFKPILDKWEQDIAAWDPMAAKAKHEADLAAWEKSADSGRRRGARPQPPQDPKTSQHRPSNLYNAMIAPLVPFAVRGAIWYQGESNAGRAYQYRTLMPAVIRSWRSVWKQGDFPFYQVQLANFKAKTSEPGDSDWAELREAQMLTCDAEKNVGVACIIDIGAAKDIHPKDKQNVGKRLARLALVDNYGFAGKITRSGPTYRSLDIQGEKCIVHFDNLGEGPLKGLTGWYGEPLKGFAIAGPDKKFVWAEAKIEGNTVIVSSPSVKEPVAVRYNWADNPDGNLYSKVMLPAYPFRTDDWEGITVKNVTP
jgi:sialate O-acetylesterase